jgi:hypothetical protein
MSKAVLEIYEALKFAGVPEDKAQNAVKGEINLIKWMLCAIIPGILSLTLKTYF